MEKLGNFKVVCFTILAAVLFVASPINAAEIVIDPGHGPDETGNSGGAFTVDWLGSELELETPIGEFDIAVTNAELFSKDTQPHNYSVIRIENDTYTVSDVNYDANVLTLSDPLTETYDAGTQVTVENFRIQALGYPRGTTNYANHTTHSHTHEVPASEWRDWDFMERSNGEPMGLLEYKIKRGTRVES